MCFGRSVEYRYCWAWGRVAIVGLERMYSLFERRRSRCHCGRRWLERGGLMWSRIAWLFGTIFGSRSWTFSITGALTGRKEVGNSNATKVEIC
jgi:hypothetical protein